jgi:hypothetical protein
MKPDDPGRAAFLNPGGQLVAAAHTQSTEIKNLKPAAAPGAQSGDAPESFQVVVKRGVDKDADLQIVAAGRSLPVVCSKRENGRAMPLRVSEIKQ